LVVYVLSKTSLKHVKMNSATPIESQKSTGQVFCDVSLAKIPPV
jgi:hypothetical protein